MTKLFLILLLFFAVSSTGCAKVAHMQELLRLKGYSEEKDRQELLVENQNKRFERLLAAVKSNQLENFPDQRSIWMSFGEPVFEKKITLAQTPYTVWMYRYSTKFFGSEKVYLYFDEKRNLSSFDFSPGGVMTPVKRKGLQHVQQASSKTRS
ncbi:MAG: hypothetical protein H6754_07910 [Candidatus Omnitrophica bacterium]|nr:hypothetical protein [Candidatus Omnitrophota bacterium]